MAFSFPFHLIYFIYYTCNAGYFINFISLWKYHSLCYYGHLQVNQTRWLKLAEADLFCLFHYPPSPHFSSIRDSTVWTVSIRIQEVIGRRIGIEIPFTHFVLLPYLISLSTLSHKVVLSAQLTPSSFCCLLPGYGI